MNVLVRLGYLTSMIGLVVVAGSVGAPGVKARVAYAGNPVDIEMYGSVGYEAITFGTLCARALYPGLICTDALEIRNVGDFDFEYTIEAWSDGNRSDDGAGGHVNDAVVACVNVHLEPRNADGVNVGNLSLHGPVNAGILRPGKSEAWGLEISIDDNNDCQGRAAMIFARVVATGSSGDGTPPSSSESPKPADGNNAASPNTPRSPNQTAQRAGPSGPANEPLPPRSPLDSDPTRTPKPLDRTVPPSTGNGGLIGRAPDGVGVQEPEMRLLALALVLATSGGVCCFAGFVLEQRSHRK